MARSSEKALIAIARMADGGLWSKISIVHRLAGRGETYKAERMNFLDAVCGEDGDHGLGVGDLGLAGGLASLGKGLLEQLLVLCLAEFLHGLVLGGDLVVDEQRRRHAAEDGESDVVVDGRHVDRVSWRLVNIAT